jgi:hypothetical protein
MGNCRLVIIPCAWLLGGCGASTIRVEVAPTLNDSGRPGVESALSFGLGMPLDFHGRSHHYLQALASLGGGGVGGRSGGQPMAGAFLAAAGVDYIYWAEPRLDLRAGARFTFRQLSPAADGTRLFGLGGHLGILPMVKKNDAGWLLMHLCLGPALRMEALWSSPPGGAQALFSLPLILELNLLAAGD